ncbi:twitching motility protein PilT [Devosia sp. 17-2-E-8]|nr:twitching motility protein PilT [Devosia sp. 17-2-E-8]
MKTRLLLDTCAVIWMAGGESLGAEATIAIDEAFTRGESLRVSAITAWELGLLSRRGRLPLTQPPHLLYQELIASDGIEEVAASSGVLLDSSFLPEGLHNDPADRIIIATARAHDLTIVTSDKLILDYARSGHVRALAC